MAKSSISIEQEGSQHEEQPSGFTMHEFAQNHQFFMGVVFSLTALGVAVGLIALIAALPHSNTPWGQRPDTRGAQPATLEWNSKSTGGLVPDMKAPLAVGRSVVETFWPEEARLSGHHPVEP